MLSLAQRCGSRFGVGVAALLVFGVVSALAQLTDHGAWLARCTASAQVSADRAFLQENNAAMERMMADMAITPTGDVDRDFVAMMIPHHQGAIDMARAVLRSGKNETIRRLAQEIIVTQEDEIRAMRLAIADAGPVPGPSPVRSSALPSAQTEH